jgi:hypothetical protein
MEVSSLSLMSRLAIAAVLTVVTIPLSVAPAHAGPLATTLLGAAEVPGPGDPDGSGTFVAKIKPGQGTICYTMTVTGIAPATAAHVHVGTADVAGPVVIALAPPTEGSVTACATADRDLLRAIGRNSEQYYINVHNAEYPAGALRGQLS